MSPKQTLRLLKEAFQEWNEDKASRLAAALAYYTVFSLAPLLVLIIALVGAVLGEEAARGQVASQFEGLLGASGAEIAQTMIQNAHQPGDGNGAIASMVSVVILVLGATGVFGELQDSLNTVWNVEVKPQGGVGAMVRKRILSFSMVLVIAFLLLVSLVISSILSGLNTYLTGLLPGVGELWQLLNLGISLAVITVLFALIFKILPDVEIAWKDVWMGAFITALLFTIGKFLIGLYLGNTSFASAYGAAGSVIVVLAWVYYSAQILFFGAELTQVYARRYGSHIVPSQNAMTVQEKLKSSSQSDG